MSFRPIGEVFKDVVARAEAMMAFQGYLATLPTAERKKAAIMDRARAGLISDDDAMLLISSMMLETA